MISIKPKKRWFSSPSPFDNCSKTKPPNSKPRETRHTWVHSCNLTEKRNINACERRKIYTKPNIKCGVGCLFSGMRWHLLPTFNSMSAVKTAAGRMPSQFSVSLTSPKGIATFTLMCQKASVVFAFCHVSLSFADEASAFPEVFSMTREHPPEVSSHRRMRSLEIIMAGRPPWTWVLSNTKDGAEQWETFFCGGLWYSTDRYLAYLSSKHTFVPAIFEYIYMHVMCVWLVFCCACNFKTTLVQWRNQVYRYPTGPLQPSAGA